MGIDRYWILRRSMGRLRAILGTVERAQFRNTCQDFVVRASRDIASGVELHFGWQVVGRFRERLHAC